MEPPTKKRKTNRSVDKLTINQLANEILKNATQLSDVPCAVELTKRIKKCTSTQEFDDVNEVCKANDELRDSILCSLEDYTEAIASDPKKYDPCVANDLLFFLFEK